MKPASNHTFPNRLQIMKAGMLILLLGIAVLCPVVAGQEAENAKAPPLILRLNGDNAHLRVLFLSPDGKTLGYYENHFRLQQPALVLYDLEKKKEIRRHDTLVGDHHVAFSADGKTLIVTTQQPRTLNLKTGDLSGGFPGLGSDFQLTPNGELLIGRQDVVLHIYEVASGKLLRKFSVEKHGGVRKFSVSDDGRFIVARHARGLSSDKCSNRYRVYMVLWDVATGKDIGRVGEPREITIYRNKDTTELDDMWRETGLLGPVCRVRISPGGNVMVFPYWPRESAMDLDVKAVPGIDSWLYSLRLTELQSGETLEKFTQFQGGGPNAFALSKEQKILAASGQLKAGDQKTALFVWDVSAARAKAFARKPKLTEKDLESLWKKFGEKDQLAAYRAMRKLGASPEQSLPFLAKKLDSARMLVKDDPTDLSTRQSLWGIEVLEFVANREAKEILQILAKRNRKTWLSSEALASLKRIGN